MEKASNISRRARAEYTSIRNIILNIRLNKFMLIGEGDSFGHFKGDRITFNNLGAKV
jgi:hypothetical protein